MTKEHNNLNIENLIKTDWFYQFNNFQKKEILKGLENKLDVSIYAKLEFNGNQMEQIRRGLEDDLDVFLYAKTEYTRKEMNDIRLRLKEILEKELNVNLLKNQKLTAEEMQSILNLLKAGWNIFSTEKNNKTMFI